MTVNGIEIKFKIELFLINIKALSVAFCFKLEGTICAVRSTGVIVNYATKIISYLVLSMHDAEVGTNRTLCDVHLSLGTSRQITLSTLGFIIIKQVFYDNHK